MTEDTEVLADQGRAIDPYKAFKFQTDITVADIRGGERLTREASRGPRVLLMGPAGQLFVQDETERRGSRRSPSRHVRQGSRTAWAARFHGRRRHARRSGHDGRPRRHAGGGGAASASDLA